MTDCACFSSLLNPQALLQPTSSLCRILTQMQPKIPVRTGAFMQVNAIVLVCYLTLLDIIVTVREISTTSRDAVSNHNARRR